MSNKKKIFSRSRPVVKVSADVKFLGDTKLISLTDKKCNLANGTTVACAQLMFCLTYGGVNVDQQISECLKLIIKFIIIINNLKSDDHIQSYTISEII